MDQLSITMTSFWEKDTVACFTICCTMSPFSVKEGEPVLDFADQAFGGIVPFPEICDLYIEDELGEVPFHQAPSETEYTAASYTGLYPDRKIKGTLRWRYRILPRVLPEGYRSSPYYDFRAEPLGLNGSGMFSLILPKHPKPMEVSVHWDMSHMPGNARAIWSLGEGDLHLTATPFVLRFSLFQVGVMQCVEQGGLGVYWFSEPYFKAESVANRLYPIFQYMKEYFQDPDAHFYVFLRRDPFEYSGGGSACPYAFISGYSAFGGMDEDRWFNVLIHEMTHTWPGMTDFTVGEGTWFNEGCTEYYCTMLPYQGGFLDKEYTVKRINEKIRERYYQNIYRTMSNEEIPAVQWKDRRAQTVPYGRGFLYLANVEVQLKNAGKGKIADIIKGHNMLNPLTPKDWEDFLRQRLGESGVREFHDMVSGKLLIPEPDLFGPEFIAVEEEIELDGKKEISYHWKVRD